MTLLDIPQRSCLKSFLNSGAWVFPLLIILGWGGGGIQKMYLVFFWNSLGRCNSHTTQSTHLKCVYAWVDLCVFIDWCSHHHCSLQNIFITPRRYPAQDLTIICYLFCVHLPILDIFCKWTHTTYNFLWLTSFTYHAFRVHSCSSMCYYFIAFYDQVILYCIDVPCFIYPVMDMWLPPPHTHLLAIMNNAA